MELEKIYELIPIGEQNAVSLQKLCERTGISGRELRRSFEQLIYLDKPVCNIRRGYFRPANMDELVRYRQIINSYKRKFEKKEYRLRKAEERFAARLLLQRDSVAK